MSGALFVAHEPDMEPGHLGDRMAAHGHPVTVLDVAAGDPFPDPAAFDRVVLLGSRGSAYDDTLPHLAAERAFVRRALDAGVPLLGVCFGGQLLARVLGGHVARMDAPELGWLTLDTEEPGLVPPGPWLVWHGDAFTVPPAAEPLARTDRAAQAFRQGRAVGLQFHPEVTPAIVWAWVADRVGGLDPAAAAARDLLDGAARHAGAARDAAHRLVDRLEDLWTRAPAA